MRIIVTGAKGRLGRDLVHVLGKSHEVFGLSRTELDVADLNQCKLAFRNYRPDAVVHAAAYTAVDRAEEDADQAYLVNAYGTRNVAVACRQLDVKVCYISTDYVFDGRATSPYSEYDPPNPQSVYGKSKRAGELLLSSISNQYFIVRTSWLYGSHGNNFVKTILKLIRKQESVQVVHDQIGSPTYTVDLCRFVNELVPTDYFGMYHASNSGFCSRYELAQAILEISQSPARLLPCTSAEMSRPAPRPSYSVLDPMSMRVRGFPPMRHWRDALSAFVTGEEKDSRS